MVSAYSNINGTVKLTLKGGSSQTITANVISYSESGIKRDVKFERMFGGAYLPSMVSGTEMTLSFTYISTDSVFIDIMDGTSSGTLASSEIFNLYKVVLEFNDGTNALGKVYYNCYPVAHSYDVSNVVRGTIKFKLSPSNISANSNYYEFNDIISEVADDVDSKDTLMEWT